MECKLRFINFRIVSDLTMAFCLAFGVTGISDDRYRCLMAVIVIGLGKLRSAGENCGCTWEHLGPPGTSLGVPAPSLGALTASPGALG